jgi:hypothetical protein
MKNDVPKRSLRVALVLTALLAVFAPAPAADAPAPYPKQLSLGEDHSCALMSDGGVKCWGGDNDGQLINLPGPAPYIQVSANTVSTCVLKSNGVADCYGLWLGAHMGDAGGNVGPFTQIADRQTDACGLRADGNVLCWNWETSHWLWGPFTQIDGYDQACGLVPAAAGTPSKPAGVYCWKASGIENGDLIENGDMFGSFTQVAVGGGSPPHKCAIHADGFVVCWGGNLYGQSSPPPGAFLQITAGNLFTCGLRTDHTLACWGYDYYGQVSDTPAGQFKQVAAGTSHACAIREDEQVYCWGRNNAGQTNVPVLGDSRALFAFRGIYPHLEPEQEDPTLNTAKAGSAVPLNFSLGGDKGLNVIAAGYPASRPLDCEQMDPRGDLEPVQSSGNSGLSYDPQNETYTYVWETDPDWAGTCRVLALKLVDGTVHLAPFQFP